MPRVKRFADLPKWLQDSLDRDWRELVPESEDRQHPSIRDPEYRVYAVGGGWWCVDCGTGGVIVQSETKSHNYVDLPEGSRLKQLVDAEGRACWETEQIELLCKLINGNGMDPLALGSVLGEMHEDGLTDAQRIRQLVGVLYDGVVHGNWPK